MKLRTSSSSGVATQLAINSAWRTFCLWYFAIRPALTLLLHSQLVLPTSWYPSILLRFHRWYVGWSGDPLLSVPPRWFQGIVVTMLTVQMPFELYALKQVVEGKKRWQAWIPVYAVHVLTGWIPVFAEVVGGTHVGMNMVRTLLPKVADLIGVLVLLGLAYERGIFASLIATGSGGPEVILTPSPTPSKTAKSSTN